MENLAVLGRWLVIAGIGIAVVGGLVWLIGKIPGVQNIPGTIKIESGGLTCVIPLLASIVLSILLTLILNVIARLIK